MEYRGAKVYIVTRVEDDYHVGLILYKDIAYLFTEGCVMRDAEGVVSNVVERPEVFKGEPFVESNYSYIMPIDVHKLIEGTEE